MRKDRIFDVIFKPPPFSSTSPSTSRQAEEKIKAVGEEDDDDEAVEYNDDECRGRKIVLYLHS